MKKNLGLKMAVVLLLLVSIVSMQACGRKKNKGAGYQVYFTNSQINKLVEVSYSSETEDTVALLQELITKMNTRQKQEDCEVIKPENVVFEKVMLDDTQPEVACVYFSKEYNDLDSARRLLLNAALVKALTQVDTVQYVQIYVDNAPAEYADGTPIGMLAQQDFVDDFNEAVGNVEWKTLTLYYADKLGDKLTPTEVAVAYNKNVSLEKVVVERLIKGPADNTLATLPPDMKLLNVTVKNRECYVNLNTLFLTEMVNVSNEIPVYSIVNSLCALDTVDSVRILINGDSNKTFRESISLNNAFTFNDELVAK